MEHEDDLASGRLLKLSLDKKACAMLAEKLEIQADGGDSPADFVSYALKAASDEYVRQDALKTLSKLEQQ